MHNKKVYLSLLTLVTIAFAIISFNRGMRADVNGDYYIYWATGKAFLTGNKLYTPGLIDGGFTYPPFAALFFSLFSFVPFYVSAFLFTFLVNYGLWIGSFVLVHKIMQQYYPGHAFKWPLGLAVVLSAGFYWHNFIWMNSNLPVLCLTLLGVLYYKRKQYGWSYVFFMAGTFFKITPVLFLIFAAIKRGPKHWPQIALTALPFILIPVLLRGVHTGIADWKDYYEAFVAPFSKGKIDENIISLGIPALLNKLNTGNAEFGIEPIFHLSASALKFIILIFQAVSMVTLVAKFAYDRYVKGFEGFSATDVCLIFMVTLLLPGRVWAHHHVCTGFIYTYLCFILIKQKQTVLLIITCVLGMLTNLITKNAIGQILTNILKHYSFVTLLMIFVTIIILLHSEKEHALVKE
ncbi:glycosyltransferase family 87 protein [uncultured Mucilaginibacter sp.]|uniref:glycosyltransferase family 87 protein n=1 Tax=uncultured Mucilaginibacter sp. TaxID=797541 RepID=UPI0025E5096D|nr:glycosyltransferase family 87 protein [uncultured Mucilaginibacter sp.]